MVLFGLKALFELEQNPAAEAVAVTLRAFHERFPEFTLDEYEQEGDAGGTVYRADPRLQSFMAELLSGE